MEEDVTKEELSFLLAQVTLKLIDLTEAHNRLAALFGETIDILKELPCQQSTM